MSEPGIEAELPGEEPRENCEGGGGFMAATASAALTWADVGGGCRRLGLAATQEAVVVFRVSGEDGQGR